MNSVKRQGDGGFSHSAGGTSAGGGIAVDALSLSDVFSVVSAEKWRVMLCGLLAFFLGWAYLFQATPIYRSDVLLQVEERGGSGALDGLPSLLGEQPGALTEIEVLRSRSIVGQVVDRQNLDIVATPRYFPVIGKATSRKYRGDDLALPPSASLSKFSWGGERISVERLDVSPSLLGVPLVIVAGEAGSYRVETAAGVVLGSGSVGERSVVGGAITLFVSELFARSGTEFVAKRIRRAQAVSALQQRLSLGEKGRSTGIIEATLSGEEPQKIRAILQDVANEYVRQNVERLSAEAEKSLEFLDAQLPALRSQLEVSESKLTSYREQAGAADLTLETRSLLDKFVGIDAELRALKLRRDEYLQRYADQHPAVLALEEQQQSLLQSREKLKTQIDTLPQTQQDVLQLTRDAKVNSELYTFLLNKTQELRVVKAGTVGNVRILDNALEPFFPVSPRRSRVLFVAVVLGVLFGLAWVAMRQLLIHKVVSPQQAEEAVGLPVYAVVPHSDFEVKAKPKKVRGQRYSHVPLLGVKQPLDPAFEAIRSLRTSLHFALMDSESKHVVITGPSPGIGKSFLSTNLGLAIAQSGKNVLIIDADMRKGHVNQYFACSREPGLSDVLSGAYGFEDCCVRLKEHTSLHLLPAGQYPPNPSELLLSSRWQSLLDHVDQMYEIVIVDTPPVMAVTDACIAAQGAAAVFVVTRYNVNTATELEATVERLSANNVEVSGLVFNGLEKGKSRQSDRYAHYHYEYK